MWCVRLCCCSYLSSPRQLRDALCLCVRVLGIPLDRVRLRFGGGGLLHCIVDEHLKGLLSAEDRLRRIRLRGRPRLLVLPLDLLALLLRFGEVLLHLIEPVYHTLKIVLRELRLRAAIGVRDGEAADLLVLGDVLDLRERVERRASRLRAREGHLLQELYAGGLGLLSLNRSSFVSAV